jgi:hypothetical protein
MKNILFAFLFLLSFNACAFDEWTTADTQREAVYLAVDYIDWAQTRNIARNPTVWRETNPFLGLHPSVGRVDGYFASMMLVHISISRLLTSDYRYIFQYISIGYEVNYVANNFNLGINAKF